jgi:hypothetical protein
MSTPHKATEQQWKIVRHWINDDAVASVFLEVADRVAALEAVLASHGEQISGLHSQHNLVVDSITDLQGSVNALEAAATPPPAPDHFPDATEMVATDEELIETFYVGARGASATPGFRAIYNLGRQHSAQSRQEEEVAPPPAPAGENVVAMVIDVIHFITGEHVADSLACGVIRAVADWLQQRSDTIANGSQWAEMLRREAEL